jgi:hypothetical protein
MPRKKIAQANTESPQVAQEVAQKKPRAKKPQWCKQHFYYEYIDPTGKVIYLDQYEWSSGMGLSHKEVKKAQAARKREVKNGYAYTKEA